MARHCALHAAVGEGLGENSSGYVSQIHHAISHRATISTTAIDEVLLYPSDDFGLHLVQLAHKKMVCILNPYQLLRLGRGRHNCLYFGDRTVLIVIATDEKFGLAASWLLPIAIVPALGYYRQTQANPSRNTRIAAASSHADIGAEGKSREQNRTVKFLIQPIECGAHIVLLSVPVVMHPLASANAAKVEAQYWKSKAVQRLHRAINHFVVQRSTTHWMRMTDQSAVGSIIHATIQQRLQRACWAGEIEGSDGWRNR